MPTALAQRMSLPQTACLALSGPLSVPESDGGRAWLTAFDEDGELIQVCVCGGGGCVEHQALQQTLRGVCVCMCVCLFDGGEAIGVGGVGGRACNMLWVGRLWCFGMGASWGLCVCVPANRPNMSVYPATTPVCFAPFPASHAHT